MVTWLKTSSRQPRDNQLLKTLILQGWGGDGEASFPDGFPARHSEEKYVRMIGSLLPFACIQPLIVFAVVSAAVA